MKLTKEQAVAECKELWAEIEASGLGKQEFLATKMGLKWKDKKYQDDCPLCEYASNCGQCPLIIKYGQGCSVLGFRSPTEKWFNAVRGL